MEDPGVLRMASINQLMKTVSLGQSNKNINNRLFLSGIIDLWQIMIY